METLTAPPPAAAASTPAPAAQPRMSADSVNHLESLFTDAPPADKPAETPNQPPAQKPTEQKPQAPAAQKLSEKPAEKAPEKKIASANNPSDNQLKGATQLRKAYEDLKNEHATLKKQFEEKYKPVEDPEKLTLKQQYEELQKRHQETDGELRFVRYEKSQEYRDKYEKPMHKALGDAESEVSELVLTDGDGNERKATIQDFAALVDMPLQKAITQAKAWFGDAATEVLAHRRKVVDLSKSAKEAVDDYKKRGSEMEKQTNEQRKKQTEELKQKWSSENQSFATRFKDNFSKKDGDDEGNALLDKGLKLVDMAYNENSGLSQEQMMKLHVVIRNRAAGFERMEHWSKQKDAKIAALEKELQGFKASVPGGGSAPRKQEGAKKELSVEEHLQSLAGTV